MAYASVANIQSRNPYVAIGASSSPTSSEVQIWLDEAEAEINGILSGAGLVSPNVNANGIKILRNKVTTYVAGLVSQALAAAGGDGGNTDGADAEVKWDAFLTDLMNNPIKWGGILQGGSAGDAAIKARSHVTHNQDGLSKSNGDFTPEYDKGDLL